MLQAGRNQYHRCILVKTTDTARHRARRYDDGAMSVVETRDPHAEAFLGVRLGGYDLAANDAQLAQMSRAVAPSGRTTAGMAYSVTRSVDLLMTRGQRGPTPESRANHEIAVAEARRLRQEAVVLREAARAAAQIRARTARAISTSTFCARRRTGSKGGAGPWRPSGRPSRSATPTGSRPRSRRSPASGLPICANSPRCWSRSSMRCSARRRSSGRGLPPPGRRPARRWWRAVARCIACAAATRSASASPGARPSIPARSRGCGRSCGLEAKEISAFASAERGAAREAGESARSHGRAAERDLAEYCAQWRIDNPLAKGDVPATFGYTWARREHEEVAGHELRRYRAQAERAEGEMRRLMTEDLLTRLADKFERVRARLDALNERLSSQTFTGQTYAFEATVDRRYAAVHALATEVARSPDAAQSVLPASGEGPMASALEEISQLIAGSEDAARLADYRNYFVYEIGMRDRAGNRTTMSSRALRGSGGEAQAPFYVAIAASLASAYYPGDRPGDENPGLGLCLLDEAFSKLDVRNSQGLVDLYRAWGLQLLIAAPEDKRTTLTEVMDTIVTV